MKGKHCSMGKEEKKKLYFELKMSTTCVFLN